MSHCLVSGRFNSVFHESSLNLGKKFIIKLIMSKSIPSCSSFLEDEIFVNLYGEKK